MISLSDGTTTLVLHQDLFWSDETKWSPVEQTVDRTITGALIVQVAARVAGRPITLEPEDDESAWMPRSSVDVLRNWAAVPGQVLTLRLHEADYSVIFRHQDGGLEARPVVHYRDVVSSDHYICVIRLLEI